MAVSLLSYLEVVCQECGMKYSGVKNAYTGPIPESRRCGRWVGPGTRDLCGGVLVPLIELQFQAAQAYRNHESLG